MQRLCFKGKKNNQTTKGIFWNSTKEGLCIWERRRRLSRAEVRWPFVWSWDWARVMEQFGTLPPCGVGGCSELGGSTDR